MKTTKILSFSLLACLPFMAMAQNHPFVFRSEIKTNPPQHVAASGVVMAHDVVTVLEIAYVATAEPQGVKAWDQPAVRIISVTTNLVDKAQVQKPLLSAQHPPPTNALKRPVASQVKKVSAVNPTISVGPPRDTPQYVNWVITNKITNAPPPEIATNHPAYRRWEAWKKLTASYK